MHSRLLKFGPVHMTTICQITQQWALHAETACSLTQASLDFPSNLVAR